MLHLNCRYKAISLKFLAGRILRVKSRFLANQARSGRSFIHFGTTTEFMIVLALLLASASDNPMAS